VIALVAVGWGVGVDARLGKGAVFVGAGAGPAVNVALGPNWDVHAEGRWLTLAGSTWLLRGGVGVHTTAQRWQPGVGLDATGYLGATLRAVTEENPGLAGDSALSLQARVDPLHFAADRWNASVLRLDVGAGWDRGRPALAVGMTVLEVGITF
jgi:hypothetical protein